MNKYIFRGIVYPERVNFNLNGLPPANITIGAFGINGEITFQIKDSRVEVIFTSGLDVKNHRDRDVLVTLKNFVTDHVRFWIDAHCYVQSLNYDVDIYEVECEELFIKEQFTVQLETDLDQSTDTGAWLNEILMLMSQNPGLLFVKDMFADFRRGIKYPQESGFYFYRAVETIKKNYFHNNWDKLNEALDFKKADHDSLLKWRRYHAHAEYPSITGNERRKLAKDARRVIDRFILYLKTKK